MTGSAFVGAAEGCESDEPDTPRFAACGSSYRVYQAKDETFK